MRPICSLLARASLAWIMLATAQTPVAGQLRDGTIVHVRLSEPINSEDAKVGDRVHFVVTRDVVVNGGGVVIARGTHGVGTIAAARRASFGFIWHRALLAFTFDDTTAIDGQSVRLRGTNGTVNGVVNIDRDNYHHGLQWASEGDTFEALVFGNYAFRLK
jgi:hypothetical protein